jgi:hypothetical protein
VTCPLCDYYQDQYHRALAEMLELRLQVADGPRSRIRELEANLAKANAKIANNNRKGPR